MVDYNFDNDRPIYIQIVEKLRVEIISGKFKPGERLPSVRELALTIKVNPNTMQKALVELEDEKLVYTERTNGKFVTQDDKLINSIRKKLAKEQVNKFLVNMQNIGITRKEALVYLQELGGEFDGTYRN